MRELLLLLNALLLAVGLILALGPAAERIGLLDKPRARKVHVGAVPVTGGLAIFGAFILTASQAGPSLAHILPLAAGLAVLVALGLADDLHDLSPRLKLAGQAAAALILIPAAPPIDAGALLGLGGSAAPQLDFAVTLLFVVGMANALNMIDGLDGLAGGVSASALFWLAAAAIHAERTDTLMYVLLLLAAVLAFLFFNAPHPWRRAGPVFMGDAGSMMLGAAIAYFVLELSGGPGQPSFPSLLWLLVLPVSDTLVLMLCRVASGHSPLRGDRRHVHHRLLEAGVSSSRTAALLVAICFACGAVGIAGSWLAVSGGAMLSMLLVPFALHSYFVLGGWRLLAVARGKPVQRASVLDEPAPSSPASLP